MNRQVTTPRIMRTPRVDHDALQRHLDEVKSKIESADIKTRSQVRLEENERERERLEELRTEARTEITKLEKFRAELDRLIDAAKANEADINVDLAAVLASINSLRESGVETYKAPADGQ
jgi:DNA repair exonuclease SbcCD ATPase subunit